MMRATKTIGLTLVGALLTPALLFGPAADADVRKGRDPKGDAPKAIDITRFKMINGKKRMTYILTFRSLKLGKVDQIFGSSRPKSGKDDLTHFNMGVRRYGDGRLYTFFSGHGEVERYMCRELKVTRPKKNKIRISAPQRCFGKFKGPMTMYAKAFKPNWDNEATSGQLKYLKRG